MRNLFFVLVVGLLLFLADLYVFKAVEMVMQGAATGWQHLISVIYWGWFGLTFITFALAYLTERKPPSHFKTYLATVLFIVLAAKVVVILFLLLEDVVRGIRWVYHYFSSEINPEIPRNKVWSGVALLAGAVPLAALLYGMAHGAYHYQVKKVPLKFPNLPPGFEGFKIVHITDLHTGSFANAKPLKKAVNLINAQQPDVIFFTGDLVNNVADEVEPYIPVLGKLQARQGVFSVLGNHDYGDYIRWPSRLAKIENLQRLKNAHGRMGWKLLVNEHAILTQNNEAIAVIGVENWGNRAGFPKYGKLAKAYQGTENIPFKILLSHDPSHWHGEVTTHFPGIDLTLSGHTHGMQFGLNLPFFRWSPVQYVYKQWNGLYQHERQFLYVNVGLGFLGYPGRVGFRPEITVFELHRAQA